MARPKNPDNNCNPVRALVDDVVYEPFVKFKERNRLSEAEAVRRLLDMALFGMAGRPKREDRDSLPD